MKKIDEKKAFILVSAAFLISALSVWMVPIAFNNAGTLCSTGYAAGVIFWAGLLIGIALYIFFFGKEYGRPDIKRIFKNTPAILADAIFIIALMGTIYSTLYYTMNQWVMETILFLLILSLYSHFLLNGKVFEHIYGKRDKQGLREKGVEEL